VKMLGSVNGRQFLDYQSDCEFPKKGSNRQSQPSITLSAVIHCDLLITFLCQIARW
jgi:hypothetical protein